MQKGLKATNKFLEITGEDDGKNRMNIFLYLFTYIRLRYIIHS